MTESLFDVAPDVCTHPRELWKYLRTYPEIVVYLCLCCGKEIRTTLR